MYWYGGHMGGWGYGLMALSVIGFWVLIVVGVIVVARYLNRGERSESPAPRTADEILAERFARGEIDEDEYHGRLQTLQAESRR